MAFQPTVNEADVKHIALKPVTLRSTTVSSFSREQTKTVDLDMLLLR
jgi:hypothetical protein